MLGQSWAGAGESLLKQKRVLVNEAERNEFGEAAGLRMNLAEERELTDPVGGSFHVSVHEGRGAANAALVRSADDFPPLRGGEFVTRENLADVVVENFGGGAGERIEAVIAQHG